MQTEQGKKDMQNTSDQASQEKDPISVKTVLIVDDDVDIGETLMAILQEDAAYQTVYVSDGCAALTVVRTLIPQLILLDYHMPKMDGLECLDKLRESKGLEQTPVGVNPSDQTAHQVKKYGILEQGILKEKTDGRKSSQQRI